MKPLSAIEKSKEKEKFKSDLKGFAAEIQNYVSAEDGEWTIKGFIDIYKNLYTISSDTKIVSKILEIHLFPKILEFAESIGYNIVLAEHQNWYPDLSFVQKNNQQYKFAVDLKTTYRELKYPGHVNGFTLGSHGAYFKNRKSTKNIQFPYSDYSGHFCLGIIYTRTDSEHINETEILAIDELADSETERHKIGNREVTKVENLRAITSVIKDFQFFACEKWEIASDRQGSGNTANIGSITSISDILNGNGVFSKLGEECFDEYWMNYKVTSMIKEGKATPITRIEDFLSFKGKDKTLITKRLSKRKVRN